MIIHPPLIPGCPGLAYPAKGRLKHSDVDTYIVIWKMKLYSDTKLLSLFVDPNPPKVAAPGVVLGIRRRGMLPQLTRQVAF